MSKSNPLSALTIFRDRSETIDKLEDRESIFIESNFAKATPVPSNMIVLILASEMEVIKILPRPILVLAPP